MEVGRTMASQPKGNFPPGTRSQMVMIVLNENDWPLCYAHRYVREDGTPVTRPDPKAIHLDDIVLRQPPKVRETDNRDAS